MDRERGGAELTENSNQLHPRHVDYDPVDDDGDDEDDEDGGGGEVFGTEATCECEAPDTWPVIVPEAPKRLQMVIIIVRYYS